MSTDLQKGQDVDNLLAPGGSIVGSYQCISSTKESVFLAFFHLQLVDLGLERPQLSMAALPEGPKHTAH